MGIKFVQASDFHLGSPLTGLGPLAAPLREELLGVFFRTLTLCRQEEAQLLLLPGDIWDGAVPDPGEWALFCDALERLEGVEVFIAPGNHDPATIDSPWLSREWPRHVHIFRGDWEAVELPEHCLRVWGAGFIRERQESSLLASFSTPRDGWVNVGVLHGDLSPQSPYNPLTPEAIAQSGLTYLALGHIHLRSDLQRIGATAYAYSGCPAGRGFDETGEKGAYVGEIENGQVSLRFVPLGARQFTDLAIDVSGCGSASEALAAIQARLSAIPGGERDFYKLRLRGEVPPELAPQLSALPSRLAESLYFVKLRDETRTSWDIAALAEEISLRGAFVKRMEALRAQAAAAGDAERVALCEKALQLGLLAFAGEVSTYGN